VFIYLKKNGNTLLEGVTVHKTDITLS